MLNRIEFLKTVYGFSTLLLLTRSLIQTEKNDLRSKYKFEYNNRSPFTGWTLYSTEMLESGSVGKNQESGGKTLNEIGSKWKSLPESEKDLWKEKAKTENEKRAEANEPAILKALKDKEFLALSQHEFLKYKPKDMYIYKYELSVQRLKITKKILSDISRD